MDTDRQYTPQLMACGYVHVRLCACRCESQFMYIYMNFYWAHYFIRTSHEDIINLSAAPSQCVCHTT